MLLPVSLSVLSFQGSRDVAIDSLVKDVGKSEPNPGSARRQLLASGVTFVGGFARQRPLWHGC